MKMNDYLVIFTFIALHIVSIISAQGYARPDYDREGGEENFGSYRPYSGYPSYGERPHYGHRGREFYNGPRNYPSYHYGNIGRNYYGQGDNEFMQGGYNRDTDYPNTETYNQGRGEGGSQYGGGNTYSRYSSPQSPSVDSGLRSENVPNVDSIDNGSSVSTSGSTRTEFNQSEVPPSPLSPSDTGSQFSSNSGVASGLNPESENFLPKTTTIDPNSAALIPDPPTLG